MEKRYCDEVNCESFDRKGELQIGHMVFRCCFEHIEQVNNGADVEIICEGVVKINAHLC